MNQFDIKITGLEDLNAKLADLMTQLDTTVQVQFEVKLEELIRNIKNKISKETGPNAPEYTKAKLAVFGKSDPYALTGQLINNIQLVKLENSDNTKTYSFGVQPILEGTYSMSAVFRMWREGTKEPPDLTELSTKIAEELEKLPNFKFWYQEIGDDASRLTPILVEEIENIVLYIVKSNFK